MIRSTEVTRSTRRFLHRWALGRALRCATLAWPFLGCGGASPTEELQGRLDTCSLGIDASTKVNDDTAQCALQCLDGSSCEVLADIQKGVDTGLGITSCLHKCPVELFPMLDAPEVAFGVDGGKLSTSAGELLGKPPGNPDPDTLVGVYEISGYGSEERPAEFAVLSNTWRIRREQRQSGIAIAIECAIDVGGGVSDQQTLQAFVSSPIELHDWGIKILETHNDDKVYTNFGYDVHCGVAIAALDLPYCLTGSRVPKGYTTCVTTHQGNLTFVGGDAAGVAGKKISN